MSEEHLIPVFIPALRAMLLAAEERKGSPLTQDEVISTRDSAACIMMAAADAKKMESTRGPDIDPENCWYDFQMLRRELGRKPDLDPGARTHAIQGSDPEYVATIQQAQSTLPQFEALIRKFESESCLLKTRLGAGADQAYVWLLVRKRTASGFLAELFEIPPPLKNCEVGQVLQVDRKNVLDWMINDNGTIHGAFSLRYHRKQLDPKARTEFDSHIGAHRYV